MTSIMYGGDYNPEQWDVATIEEDIALMQEAKVNLVTVGVFSWERLQPAPGEFNFAWLDAVLDKLHRAGISVDLATATASPPAWLGVLHPETLPVTADGVRLSHGSRQGYNPSSAIFRREVERMARTVVERYATHPAVVMWHVHNEYACHVKESFDDESAAAFRLWLQKKYVSLNAFNEAWGTAFWSQGYSSWDHVMPPRATPTMQNPHALVDWKMFSSDTLLALYCLERDIIRGSSSEAPITTNFMGAFEPLDYWQWATEIDVISNDSYPDPADPRSAKNFAFESDLMRSLGGGKPFVQLEQSPSAVQWRTRNAAKRPGMFRLWSLQTVARGADGICQFQWRQSRAGAETFHSGMVPHAGRDSLIWQESVNLGADLERLAPVAGSQVSADIAIVWDWESAWTKRASIGLTDADPLAVARDWHGTFFELGIQSDFVQPGGDVSPYRVIIVPALFVVGEETAKWLAEAAVSGVTVLITARTGVVDAAGHAHLGGYLGPLAAVAGVRVTDQFARAVVPSLLTAAPVRPGILDAIEPGVDRITASINVPSAVDTVKFTAVREQGIDGLGVGWLERVIVADAEVLAVFEDVDADQWPAITRAHRGAGAVWYVATDPDASARAQMIELLCQEAGVVPTLSNLPGGVEAVQRGSYLFVLNHGDESVDVAVPTGMSLLGCSSRGGQVTIPGRDAVVIEVANHEKEGFS